jgi:hypothetical protein
MELRGGKFMARFLVCGALVLPLLAPAIGLAQPVTIEHEEVGCIVAGKYPKMNACFAPASAAKRPRVFFRPETTTTWYYVEMMSDAPCFTAALLRPNKSLVDKKIFYYLDVQGGDARTPEYAPTVVASEGDCKSTKPVAPLSATGPAAVFPSFPTVGFLAPGTGGIPGSVIAGGVAVAAAAGGIALLSDDDGSPTTTTPGAVPTTTNPPATSPTTTLPPVTTPNPLVVACQADPRSGEVPLRVSFRTFPSGGTGSYTFEWSFGDGGSNTNPNPSHTYTTTGVFNARVEVRSGDQVADCSRSITVTNPPPPAVVTLKFTATDEGSDCGPPLITIDPPNSDCVSSKTPGTTCTHTYPTGTVVKLSYDADLGCECVDWSGACEGTLAPPGSDSVCTLPMNTDLTAGARFDFSCFTFTSRRGPEAARPVTGSTQLEVPDGEGQVILNGRIASAVRSGVAAMAIEGRRGTNRVEAVLVNGAGRPGTWRFEFNGQAVKPGSLKVVAGTVALITGDAVVFRLKGNVGERVVFTFEVQD